MPTDARKNNKYHMCQLWKLGQVFTEVSHFYFETMEWLGKGEASAFLGLTFWHKEGHQASMCFYSFISFLPLA